MGPFQRNPEEVARATRYSGLGVHSVGPVGDFLDKNTHVWSGFLDSGILGVQCRYMSLVEFEYIIH